MKRYWVLSLSFLASGLAAGVYYREFTQAMGFEGRTSLAFAHPHLLFRGALAFLLLFFLTKTYAPKKKRLWTAFEILYPLGLFWTALMMLVRGTLQVLGTELGKMDAMISGIAGIGHIVLAAGLIILFVNLLYLEKKETK